MGQFDRYVDRRADPPRGVTWVFALMFAGGAFVDAVLHPSALLAVSVSLVAAVLREVVRRNRTARPAMRR